MSPDGKEIFKSELGEIEIISLNDMIISCNFSPLYSSENIQSSPLTRETAKQLKAYFDRKLKKFDLPLDYNGTELQLRLMKMLELIPYGETVTYSQLAKKLELTSGSRAVGNLVGKNPLLIIVPCHRVLGSNGKITGYAAGPDRKRWLLQHEINNSIGSGRLF